MRGLVLVGLAMFVGMGCSSSKSMSNGGSGGNGTGGSGGTASGGSDGGAESGGAGGSAGGGGAAGTGGVAGSAGAGGMSGSGGGGTGGASGAGGSAGAGGSGGGGAGSGGAGGSGGAMGDGGTGKACGGLAGLKCSPGGWCDYPGDTCGQGDQLGQCKQSEGNTRNCGEVVCGCDGHAYPNACAAHIRGSDTSNTKSCIPGNGGDNAPCGKDSDCQTGFKCCTGGGALGSPLVCKQVPAGYNCPALP